MKKLLLLYGIVLGCGEVIAQPAPAIEYSFDAAGNRIKRFLSVEDSNPPYGSRLASFSDTTGTQPNNQNSKDSLLSQSFLVSAYPNPTDGLVFINIEGYQSLNPKPNLILSDANGKIVSSQLITSAVFQINMTEFADGTYFLRVFTGEKSKSFIINKKG